LRALAAVPAAGLVPFAWMREAVAQQRGAMFQADPFKPEEANSPLGEGKGIHPGRVAWTRDAKATTWDGTTGFWWEDAYNDQKIVNGMSSRLLQGLTGSKNDKQAWDALFRSFNETHKLGKAGYRPGETVAIKLNCNQDRTPEWGQASTAPSGPGRGPRPPLNGLPSPHAVYSLVADLIEAGGVRGEDILIYDVAASRNVGNPIFAKIRANSNPQFQAVKFLVGADYKMGGRMFAEHDAGNPVRFSKAGVPTAYLAKQVTQAKYLINMALMRPHGMAGVTLTGKNHFGSVYFPNDGGWTPAPLHPNVLRTQPMGAYNALVDLTGHRHLGGKTMLFVLDGLYSAAHNEGNVMRFASFDNHWASSLLMSQDPVAIDSVALDILRNEPNAVEVRGHADNYLHEEALAAKPPSGTVYNPDGSGTLASLGAHEHWNNASERKYSRNLGRKQGIELVAWV
jgi:uncharacterized protein (DUF362 family)